MERASGHSRTKGKHRTPRGPTLKRLQARKWAHQWEHDTMELVPAGGAAQGPEDHGYTEAEVREAVEVARSGGDLGALHEAVAVMRDVSASGLEGCRDLLKHNGVQALVRRLEKQEDAALEEDVVLCLLNIVAHEKLRAQVADRGVVMPLVRTLKSSRLTSTRANVAATLSVLTQSEVQTWTLLVSGALPALLGMLERVRDEGREGGGAQAQAPPAPSAKPTKEDFAQRSLSQRSSSGKGLLFSPSFSSSGDNSVHDACLALLHLSRFRPFRKALLKLEVVPLLADIAGGPYAGVSKQAIAALLQVLAKADGGAEALTQAHGGVGAETLLRLAEDGIPRDSLALAENGLEKDSLGLDSCVQGGQEGKSQVTGHKSHQGGLQVQDPLVVEVVLDALFALAVASDESNAALRDRRCAERLQAIVDASQPPELVRQKIMGLKSIVS